MLKKLLSKQLTRLSGVGVIFLLCLVSINSRAATRLAVQFPPDNIFVEHGIFSVVLKMEKNIFDAIRISGGAEDENASENFPVDPKRVRACIAVKLNLGLNNIKFQGLRKGRVVESVGIKVFFRSDLYPKFRKVPAGLKRYYFHIPDNEQSCSGCHEMEPTLSNLRPEEPQDSPCYSCHAKKIVNNLVHDPAAKWTCFTCHEVIAGGRKYTISKPDEKACYPCHHSEIKQWKNKKIMHGPAAVGYCTLCHNPHGAAWQGLLKMQTTYLCVNCHEEKASGAHVIAGFYGKGHPVNGVKDPLMPEREFTCASCHDPHAGSTRNMLKHDASNLTIYCTTCHEI